MFRWHPGPDVSRFGGLTHCRHLEHLSLLMSSNPLCVLVRSIFPTQSRFGCVRPQSGAHRSNTAIHVVEAGKHTSAPPQFRPNPGPSRPKSTQCRLRHVRWCRCLHFLSKSELPRPMPATPRATMPSDFLPVFPHSSRASGHSLGSARPARDLKSRLRHVRLCRWRRCLPKSEPSEAPIPDCDPVSDVIPIVLPFVRAPKSTQSPDVPKVVGARASAAPRRPPGSPRSAPSR